MKVTSSLLLKIFLYLLFLQFNFAFSFPIKQNNNIVVIEYYDYECPHCRHMQAVVDQLKMQYPKLDIINRVTPLLNSESYSIAAFALATRLQAGEDAWSKMHEALMQMSRPPSLSDAEEIAVRLGLNFNGILKAMQEPAIKQEIQDNIQLAENHAVLSNIYLPIIVLGSSDRQSQVITLTGEQSYDLLSAVIQQFIENKHDQLVQIRKETESLSSRTNQSNSKK